MTPLLGVLAQITPWKGQDDAVRALAALKAHMPERAAPAGRRGEVRAEGGAIRQPALPRRAGGACRAPGVEDSVSFLGEREDVPDGARARSTSCSSHLGRSRSGGR